jgi:hypothetical protein
MRKSSQGTLRAFCLLLDEVLVAEFLFCRVLRLRSMSHPGHAESQEGDRQDEHGKYTPVLRLFS